MATTPVTWISHPACLLHEMGPYHPECPDRLRVIDKRLGEAGLLARMRRLDAPLAPRSALEAVHAHGLVANVLDTPVSSYRHLDPDTAMNAHTAQAALRAAGAALMAVDAVLADNAGLAFCAVRPPGHHAERETPMGFCFFDNIAVAAAHALDDGLDRVAVVDFDVHYGNGTADIFRDDPRVLVCNTYQDPLYPYWRSDPGCRHRVDVPLAEGAGGSEYRAAVRDRWLPALRAHAPELILISAGFDAHAADPLAGLSLHADDYAWTAWQLRELAAECCGGRMVASLEGGYDLEALAESVEAFLRPFLEN